LCEATATTGVFAAPHVVMKAPAVKTLEMKDLEIKDLEINNLEMKDLETKNPATTHDFAAVPPCAQKKSRAQKSPA
jgi:hypothetical protein